MARHYLYWMDGSAPAPAGDGDTRSWFLFYKWNVEGEVFVPHKRPFLDIAAGDYLWFVLDGALLGYVIVLRTIQELHYMQEIWYAGDETFELDDGIVLDRERNTQSSELPAETAEAWLATARRSIPPSTL